MEWSITTDASFTGADGYPTHYYPDPGDTSWGEHHEYSGTDTLSSGSPSGFGDHVGAMTSQMLGGGAAVYLAGQFGAAATGWAAASWPTMAAGAALGTIGGVLASPVGLTMAGIAGAY